MTSAAVKTRERLFWIAVVAVLATSLAWLTAFNVVLLLHSFHSGLPVTLRVVRVLFRAGASLVGHAGPGVPAGFAVWPMIALLAPAPLAAVWSERGARHA